MNAAPARRLHRGARSLRREERGETLIEFAFASVIFLTMIFGALEFGIAVWNYNLVSDLAQEGARYAAVHGQMSLDPKDASAVQSFVYSRGGGLSITTTLPAAPNTLPPGSVVEVQVSHTVVAGGGLLPFWNFPITSTARMIVAR